MAEAPAPTDVPKSAVAATIDLLKPQEAESKTLKIENTEKRDTLIEAEKRYQKAWEELGVFQPDAPSIDEVPFDTTSPDELHEKYPKWFGNFAYPYMNGTLHAGHGFTASKVEFTAGFQRMIGKRTLFPLGYHVTGMPIKACADKLVREVEMFGQNFERCPVEDVLDDSAPPPPAPTQAETKTDITKFKAHKGKAAAKTVKTKYQFQIMLAQGIQLEEIHKFSDPFHWIQFFPPLAKRDLTNFGARIDWRRQFVTTDANPYYDAFVAWQMRKLLDLKKIIFAKRYTVYSPKDGQACMDHDRQSGEGVGIQEYTALKMKVVKWADSAKELEGKVPEGASAYFIPATLRPETMYGQTSCFVSPTIQYGLFKVTDTEYFVCSERSARNMSYQPGIFPEWGQFPQVASFNGKEVVGTIVNAPLSVHKEVYILPMETVKDTKGTAVVTCVPSDSPDDYITSFDLAKKAEYYGIQKEWVKFDDILPIIETPTYGNLTAKKLVEDLKIQSPKDATKLADAKEKAYKEGFYKGKMLYGDFTGKPVEEAKNLVRKQLVDAGYAFPYAEPDGKVMSRSGDDCVAALLDQWYMNYGTAENGGDGEWAEKVRAHIEGDLNLYYPEAKNQFLRVVDWLSNWACARSYGLGTKVPWDPSVMVESLSDSTIYPAYYTFAHLLHKDMFGKEPGALGIQPDQLTDDVWDYVFARRDRSDLPQSDIPKKALETMRRHFDYWYPFDMRTSGKDLIQNHLTFNLYVHTAIFPKENWPRSFRVNGHLLLNGDKMSKSTGNFLTIAGAVEKFGADATRIALADAGDEITDANFEETVANSNILKLFELRKWCEELVGEAVYVSDASKYAEKRASGGIKNIDIIQRQSGSERLLFDDMFDNEVNLLVEETYQHYSATSYKLALKSGFYDFTSARDFYREATKAAGVGMHQDLVKKFIELQALLLAPIAPHWAEYIWLEVLKKDETIQKALWPKVPAANAALTAAREFVRTTQSNITSAEGAAIKRLSKGKAAHFDPKKEKKITIFAAKEWPAWQTKYIDLIRNSPGPLDIKAISKSIDKAESKKAMPFINSLKRRLDNGEPKDIVLNRELAFDELSTLRAMVPGLKQTVQKCIEVEIVTVAEGGKEGIVIKEDGSLGEVRTELPPTAGSAEPGSPSFAFENVENLAVR
ncbi:leucyl-tRNA synthetase [Cucurbitaria berberidis CBS 394.84]|uniref:leucine--tRNA ligase n=1 Tax=Cucurbitaria berberidis CBS 394.84 TaxID=1168544 RepID=A0A9P4LFK9_9PLEO|nr:leucyl-tRNA synthetase [Cucurbitaria berberidis CBS 394.84]KAF1852184.1 leucyl-tRNA synthetase [Cucurbitaria berberidis CBS 394.84]